MKRKTIICIGIVCLLLAAGASLYFGINKKPEDFGLSVMTEISGDLSDLKAPSLDGETFTADSFKDYDLTVINIWSTTCTYSLGEMEGLQKFYQQCPENINFITICADAASDTELAQALLKNRGCTFKTLIGNRYLHEGILKDIPGTPTTIFVDRNGTIIGDSAVGSPCTEDMDRNARLYLAMAMQHLALAEESAS